MHSYLYILTDENRSGLYIDATSDLGQRLDFHANSIGRDPAQERNFKHLIYLENFPDISQAIERRRQLRRREKSRKWAVVLSANPSLAEICSLRRHDPG